MNDDDDGPPVGSHLVQPAAGQLRPKPEEAGDIAVAGSTMAQEIRTLPVILAAPKPPIIQLQGVTSIVQNGPIDTEPYSNLLRDRLNAGDDNKVHYMERQLPQARHHREGSDNDLDMSADYQLMAELQGNARHPMLTLQVQLIDAHTNQIVFDQSYRIRQEAASPDAPGGAGDNTPPPPEIAPTPPPSDPTTIPTPSPNVKVKIVEPVDPGHNPFMPDLSPDHPAGGQ